MGSLAVVNDCHYLPSLLLIPCCTTVDGDRNSHSGDPDVPAMTAELQSVIHTLPKRSVAGSFAIHETSELSGADGQS